MFAAVQSGSYPNDADRRERPPMSGARHRCNPIELKGIQTVMPKLRKALRVLDDQLESWLIVFFYGYFCVVVLVEVIRRYVFSSSSSWGEETARYAFVFLVYIAVAQVAKNRDHIRIDIVPRRLGPKGRFILYLYFDLLYLVLCGFVFFYSVKMLQLSIRNDISMMGFMDVNLAYAQAALPFGTALLVFRVIQRFIRTATTFWKTGEVAVGGAIND